jgi:hypothetical protein
VCVSFPFLKKKLQREKENIEPTFQEID